MIDAVLHTNVTQRWSIGDVTGGYPFTHVANTQGSVLAIRNGLPITALQDVILPLSHDGEALHWAAQAIY